MDDPKQDSKVLCENMCNRLDWMLVDELVWEARLDSCKKDVTEFEEKSEEKDKERKEVRAQFAGLKTEYGEAKKTMTRHLLYQDMLEKIKQFETKKNTRKDISAKSEELHNLKRKRSDLEYVFEQRKKQCHALFTSINELEVNLGKEVEPETKNTIDPEALENVDAEELKARLITMMKEDQTLNHLAEKLLQGTSEGMQAQLESSGLGDALSLLANL